MKFNHIGIPTSGPFQGEIADREPELGGEPRIDDATGGVPIYDFNGGADRQRVLTPNGRELVDSWPDAEPDVDSADQKLEDRKSGESVEGTGGDGGPAAGQSDQAGL